MVVTHLSVLTLNCWGVFTGQGQYSRKERVALIAEEMAKGEHNIVLLQEIWVQSDYKYLVEKLADVYPYTHYWHSGTFGSGLCIFSKHEILDSFTYRFSLNGYAHKFIHTDWHCGKAVGFAKVLVGNLRVNVYCTHTHAWYDSNPLKSDYYAAHRVTQGFEMSQFIKHTSDGSDAVIVGGDFNSMPEELPYKLVKSNGNLLDAWLTQSTAPATMSEGPKYSPGGSFLDGAQQADMNGSTNGRPDNVYTPPSELVNFPNGYRIDFLMYRANSGFEMCCERCWLTMGKIPGHDFPYSDHEGLAGKFTIRSNPISNGQARSSGEIETVLSDTLPVIETGLKKVKSDQVFFSVALFLCVVALTFSSQLDLPYGLNFLVITLRILLTLGVGIAFWIVMVVCNCETNNLTAVKKDMNNILRSNPGYG